MLRFQRSICTLVTSIILAALTIPAAIAGPPDGKGGGNGGGGGGGGGGDDGGGEQPPADPAIAFNGGGELMVMNADGTNVTSLGIPGVDIMCWSPDLDGDSSNGYQGTLAIEVSTSEYPSVIALVDVRIANGIPTALRLRQVAQAQTYYPDFSPDLDPVAPGYQGRLVYTDMVSIFTQDVQWDGNATDPSTIDSTSIDLIYVGDEVAEMLVLYPVLSNDGNRIAYSAWGEDFTYSLRILDDLVQPQPRILSDMMPDIPQDLDWSNRSNTLAYSLNSQVYLANADVPGSETPLPVVGRSVSFNPEDMVLAIHATEGRDLAIKKFDLVTGELTTLLAKRKVSYAWPAWRPE